MRFRLPPPLREGDRRGFAWSFVDQGFSSATNFALSVLAGRLLGPTGLGAVALAFSIYTVALVLQRSLLTSILLAFTSALDPTDRAWTARVGLTLSVNVIVSDVASSLNTNLAVPCCETLLVTPSATNVYSTVAEAVVAASSNPSATRSLRVVIQVLLPLQSAGIRVN